MFDSFTINYIFKKALYYDITLYWQIALINKENEKMAKETLYKVMILDNVLNRTLTYPSRKINIKIPPNYFDNIVYWID